MKKLYFLILLILCASCRMNSSSPPEGNKVENDKVQSFSQYTGSQILDTLGKFYGNDPHIFGIK